MIKKTLFLLLLTLSLSAMAQLGAGKWVTHSRFSIENAQTLVDADAHVYYTVSNNLYRFDKTTKQQEVLNQQSGLHGLLVSDIYYNDEKKCLIVVYDDCNIDVIQADGSIVNVPDVKNVVMWQSKRINDVSFAGNKAYIATDFGYLVMDMSTFKIIEQKNLSVKMTSVIEVGDWLVLSNPNGVLAYAKLGSTLETFSNFKAQSGIQAGKLMSLSNNSFVLGCKNGLIYYTLTPNQNGTATFAGKTLEAGMPDNITQAHGGVIANYRVKGYYLVVDATGKVKKVQGGKELYGSSPNGDGTLWSISEKGLHSSVARETYYMPNSISIVGSPWWMAYNPNIHKLYLANTSDNGVLDKIANECEMSTYDGTKWEKANPEGATGQGWYWPCIAPSDTSDTYYIAARIIGVFKVTNNKVVTRWSNQNAPFAPRKPALGFDPQGNLWAVHTSTSPVANPMPVKVLPKSKLSNTQPSRSDWVKFDVKGLNEANVFKRSVLAISKETNIKAASNGDYKGNLVFWQTSDNVTDGVVKRQNAVKSLTSRNGATFTWTYIYALVADNKDNFCIGTTGGLAFLKAQDALSDNPVVTCPHELDGTTVYCVAVDNFNRKWVGTDNAGIYVLTEDCSAVLHHFTSENSSLISNVVYQMCCNTDNNSMFIVTPTGVQQYFSDYVDPLADYSKVYATPNPVRPNFTGYVTISGLKANSTVVIKNSEGSEVARLKSKGATVAWNACDAQGERVPTGSYSVYASQEASTMPQQPCARIMVIK